MSNEDVYTGGLLRRALDPRTQPVEIRAFLNAEIHRLLDAVSPGTRLLDVGCGTGRHLALLGDRLGLGVGVDYEHSYLIDARRASAGPTLRFITGDAAAVPLLATFDLATCMTNTWGTMRDKAGVLGEMRRLAPRPATRLISVYAETSIPARREWYRRLGQDVTEETPEYLATAGGFRSEHFTEVRLRALVGACTIDRLAGIGYLVRF